MILLLHSPVKTEFINNLYCKFLKKSCITKSLYKDKKKTSAFHIKECITDIFNSVNMNDISIILCCDAEYFKSLTGFTNADKYLYEICKTKDNKDIIYCPNYWIHLYNPADISSKISKTIDVLNNYLEGNIKKPLQLNYKYLTDVDEIKTVLNKLIIKNQPLICDIETFSLKFYEAGLFTIAFASSLTDGYVIQVDTDKLNTNTHVKDLLRRFFILFNNKLIFHNASYDVTVLIYQLFMTSPTDYENLLIGLDNLTKNIEDTKLIAYCCLNSTSQISLRLKDLAQEYTGNYAVDNINDVLSVPIDDLVKYNFIDCVATKYVYDKYINQITEERLETVYNLFKDSLKDIIQSQLIGLPLNMETVLSIKKSLEDIRDEALNIINSHPIINEFEYHLKEKTLNEKNSKLKVKKLTINDIKYEKFNISSNKQLSALLYESNWFGLPVIDLTNSGNPSVASDTIEKLINLTENTDTKQFLNAVLQFQSVEKILTSFLPAFENAYKKDDNHHYLLGNFNIGGTKSGRLSSSKINLQNLPSTGTQYGKLIKKCFKAPNGWLFVGADFMSLEDKISALQTKDPVKMSVYTDGLDAHCINAYNYYTEQMPDINPNDVKSINTIKSKYPDLRQSSKNVTFACTYQGTYHTLSKNLGLPIEKAKIIEQRYKDLYKHSIEWVKNKLKESTKIGYVTLAFGLRLRTPLLYQSVLDTKTMLIEASAESRTAGNALGQSYCMLNNRAVSDFMNKVRNSEYKTKILPVAQIHDASYYLIKADLNVLKFVNDNLIPAMYWQELPEIQHDQIKLGGELDVFYPTWAEPCTIPNNATNKEIFDLLKKHKEQNNK